ncbi:MAG: methyltransferase [Desulfobacteraceae bacterium]|nr:methyltransferase [Desulfobacteraceae bacterium]
MNNPYEFLYIYNFDGILRLGVDELNPAIFLGEWQEDNTCFLFFSESCDKYVDKLLDKNPGVFLAGRYEMTGEQWHGDKIEPYRAGDLLISPPWDKGDIDKNSIRQVLLDPGVVFGTGRHQTTEDCLALLQRVCHNQKIQKVLDIGTGTGLLALCAASFGCRQVLACDFNLLAVKTAHKNVILNGFENKVLVFQAKGEEILSKSFDLIIANIHYDVMQYLIQTKEFYQNKWFILSGLLNSETKKVLKVLSNEKIQIVERRCPDGIWNTLLIKGKKPGYSK